MVTSGGNPKRQTQAVNSGGHPKGGRDAARRRLVCRILCAPKGAFGCGTATRPRRVSPLVSPFPGLAGGWRSVEAAGGSERIPLKTKRKEGGREEGHKAC